LKDIVNVRPLRRSEKVKLRRLKRQRRNAVNSRNARIVMLSVGHQKNAVIAQMVGCSGTWVRRIIHRFNDSGIDGITWYPWFQTRSARVFTADIREQIADIALSSPIALIGMTQWSLPKLRQYLVEQKIIAHISIRWLGEILRRYKVRLRRTKTWKESTDPLFAKKYRAIRRLYRHRPVDGRRLCIDEFGPLNLQPRRGHCYKGPGKHVQRLRATYNRKLGVRHFLAYYDLETDRLYGRFTQHKKAKDFLSFLRWVRSRYPRGQKLHIVMDNYSPHITDMVLTWANSHNVRIYWTPTNGSWLNRIECHFTALKKFALRPSDHRSHEEQQAAIESYLTWRNHARDISITAWEEYKCERRQTAAAA
jgi:transposase/DNA-binding Lrp family transcriptional regulator